MTREHKISLIVGFALVLLVAVAVSDHLSSARSARLDTTVADADGWAPQIAALSEPAPADSFPASPLVGADSPIDRSLALADRPAPARPEPQPPSVLDRLRDRFAALRPAGEVDTLPAAERPGARRPHAAVDGVTWHTVAEGESLWSIAEQQYGDGSLYRRLAEFNADRVPDADSLRAGVRLRLPPRSVLDGSAAPTKRTRAVTPPRPATTPRTYIIRPGDTLGVIAQRELGTVRRMNEIIALNPTALADPDVVPVGVTIRLPEH